MKTVKTCAFDPMFSIPSDNTLSEGCYLRFTFELVTCITIIHLVGELYQITLNNYDFFKYYDNK